jgi:hypothetical protein
VSLEPQPGTLPRLRFGAPYRVRAHAADLAGNSVPAVQADAAGFDQATAEERCGRFEPVPAPAVARPARASRSSAWSARLVVREYERILADAPITLNNPTGTTPARRLVYADSIPIGVYA